MLRVAVGISCFEVIPKIASQSFKLRFTKTQLKTVKQRELYPLLVFQLLQYTADGHCASALSYGSTRFISTNFVQYTRCTETGGQYFREIGLVEFIGFTHDGKQLERCVNIFIWNPTGFELKSGRKVQIWTGST